MGSEQFDIVIYKDLNFSENKEKSKKTLTFLESLILKRLLENDGFIAKEAVADLKWGEGSYDQYSDQAIGKTMQRLRKKLGKYAIKTIPKVGFKLTASNL